MNLEEARQRLANGDAMSAFQALKPTLGYPGELESLDDWKQCFELFADISSGLGATEFSGTIRRVASDPDDVNSLYDFGYEAYEEGLFGPAATALARANLLAPGQTGILSELASCLEHAGWNEEAARVLRDSGVAKADPLLQYLLGFNSLMCGNLEEAEELLPGISDGENPNLPYMAKQLETMVHRSKALQPTDLRGWHLSLNAGVLLHLSPYGFNEGMNGRYAFIQDSYSICLEGLGLLSRSLERLGRTVPRVYMIGDRSSEILARAAAEWFKCPLEPWPGDKPGLIVVYDPSEIQDEGTFESLKAHRPGQVLWAHACDWVQPFPFTPDVTTFLYQSNTAPWGGQLVVGEEGASEVGEPDESPADDLAKEILEADQETTTEGGTDSLDALLKKARTLPAELAAGALRDDGQRQRFRDGSPIKSARFV
jgi:tetratricopeptide (TPR) repeat protein